MKSSRPKLWLPSFSGRVILIIIIVTASTGGFLLGYFVRGQTSAKQNALVKVSSTHPETPPLKDETGQESKSLISEPKQQSVSNNSTDTRKGPSVATRQSSSTAPYTVQAGAFRNKKDAGSLKLKLEAKGYKVYIKEEPDSKNIAFFKVRTGEFSDKKKAEMLALKLKKTEGLNAFATAK